MQNPKFFRWQSWSVSLVFDLHVQALEEEVVESHKNLVDSMEHWIQQDASLLAMTNEVDYDQDGEEKEKSRRGAWGAPFPPPAYAQQLEDMIAEKQEQLATLRDKTRAFRSVMLSLHVICQVPHTLKHLLTLLTFTGSAWQTRRCRAARWTRTRTGATKPGWQSGNLAS